MKAFAAVVFVGLLAVPAYAVQVATYGWENGGTILAQYGEIDSYNVGVPDPVHGGAASLKLVDQSTGDVISTPQAYIAWIKGLQDGDVVDGSFWRYDTTPTASPSCRIYGHWNDNPTDVTGYNGSAGGTDDYGPGTGWDQTAKSWTVSGGHTGLVIEVRTYSLDGHTVWIDDASVTAPDRATITFPIPEPASLVLAGLGGLVLIRRRK